MSFEEIRQSFINRDPWGLICQGKDDEIYDKVAQSTYNFLNICNLNRLTSQVLAEHIHYLLIAGSCYTIPRFEECKILADIILYKIKMDGNKHSD